MLILVLCSPPSPEGTSCSDHPNPLPVLPRNALSGDAF
jgi:hypothetical protein